MAIEQCSHSLRKFPLSGNFEILAEIRREIFCCGNFLSITCWYINEIKNCLKIIQQLIQLNNPKYFHVIMNEELDKSRKLKEVKKKDIELLKQKEDLAEVKEEMNELLNAYQ